ncbi:hypothetical protein [Acinetobacter sp. BSP-28]|uniref:hypothetical protein n=1 Tax=Acinetobacter sp. BSP-28 TaxID=3344661 RepID=UPI00376F721C
MIKLLLGTFCSIFLLVGSAVIYYWRDIQFAPSALDLWSYLIVIPLILSLILLSPYLISRAYQANQKRKAQQQRSEQQNTADYPSENAVKSDGVQWLHLNIFSSFTFNALGENKSIIEQLKNFKSPELDYDLTNGYGLPVLSYRIAALDEMLENQQNEQDDEEEQGRLQRIKALIQYQLEQQTEILWQIAEHLKQSAFFYDNELAYQYRMHPAWIDPVDHTGQEEDRPVQVEQVSRLNRLNIHVLLADNLVHVWNESSNNKKLLNFAESLGIISQQIHIEHHFLSHETGYQDWLNLLQHVATQSHEISLIINVDSEIDQEFLDEKTWLSDHYLAAEFSSSWCLTAQNQEINHIDALRTLKVALNVSDLSTCFHQVVPHHSQHIQQEQPFVLILDDPTEIKMIKKTNQVFAPTLIEMHHFLFTQPCFGHTQQLAKIFGFMLGMHLPEDLTAMIYSLDQASTHAFFQARIEENPSA